MRTVDLECPNCLKIRTYTGSASQVRCLKEGGGCGGKININKKHIVIHVSHFENKSRTPKRRIFPILNTDELRYHFTKLFGHSIRDKPSLIINAMIYNLEEIKERKLYD